MSAVILRQWTDSDFGGYFEMNTDPEVMRHFPAALTKQEASDSFARMRSGIEERGWGVWAVEVDGEFAGMTGLSVPRFVAPFTPCTEILWRFRRQFWSRGLAYAAAVQALAYGFTKLHLSEIVAFTTVLNQRSIRLMERLEFTRDFEGDFDHPGIPQGNPIRHHVLYRKRPYQSSEAAPASITPPAGQEPRQP
jgi:RimJ/RimL family protein N-acetyltransferase